VPRLEVRVRRIRELAPRDDLRRPSCAMLAALSLSQSLCWMILATTRPHPFKERKARPRQYHASRYLCAQISRES
jgi:hypothetical protein